MGNVLVEENTLQEIADSIRSKNGEATLYKPAEMPSAIQNIPTGDELLDEKAPIRFFGPEGKLLYVYTLEEVQELEQLPPLPSQPGMICQGWNWTLEEIKNEGKEVDVGAVFITDDGATRIYIDLVEDALMPALGFMQAAAHSVMIDWGDGSELESSNKTGTTNPISMYHTYAAPGEYVIRLIPKAGAQIYLGGNSSGSYLLRNRVLSTSSGNDAYSYAVRKIELGSNIAELQEYAFTYLGIKSVNIPEGVVLGRAFHATYYVEQVVLPRTATEVLSNLFTYNHFLKQVILSGTVEEIGSYAFSQCDRLVEMIIPNKVTALGTEAFGTCLALERVVLPQGLERLPGSLFRKCESLITVDIPDTVFYIGTYCFDNCDRLEQLLLPEGSGGITDALFRSCNKLRSINISEKATYIGETSFYYCNSLVKITIPEKVAEIGNSAFGYCRGMRNYYMMPKVPPVLGGTNVFSNIQTDCRIHVPKGCLEAYQTAQYWSTHADKMVEMEE